MKNIHVLPTEKPSRLIQAKNDILILLIELAENNEFNLNKHIYITSDEEIKEGDWYIINGFKKANKITSTTEMLIVKDIARKITLTTDVDLIKDGVQAIDDNFLEWFVKNQSCEFVETERLEDGQYFDYLEDNSVIEGIYENYKIIIPQEEPKQDLEKEMFDLEQELDIPSNLRWHNSKPKQDKKMYSEEEVFDLMNEYAEDVILEQKNGLNILKNKKDMTAVEWLTNKITYKSIDGNIYFSFTETTNISIYIEQAKEMQRQQIINSFNTGLFHGGKLISTGDEYYNETFKNK